MDRKNFEDLSVKDKSLIFIDILKRISGVNIKINLQKKEILDSNSGSLLISYNDNDYLFSQHYKRTWISWLNNYIYSGSNREFKDKIKEYIVIMGLSETSIYDSIEQTYKGSYIW